MKRFPMLNVILQLFIALTIGLLEKICTLIYLCLPMGLFMLIMSFRTKNNSTTAIQTFTNDRSEFQHIFPNFILVIVEPSLLKKEIQKRIDKTNSFLLKYLPLLIIVLLLGINYFDKYFLNHNRKHLYFVYELFSITV